MGRIPPRMVPLPEGATPEERLEMFQRYSGELSDTAYWGKWKDEIFKKERDFKVSQKELKPKVSTMEKMRAQRAIEMTVEGTRDAMGSAVVKRYARGLLLIGFGVGVVVSLISVWLWTLIY